ncbi:MAG: hypothetical protein RLZZ326_1354 [Planctomycetota bacterium]|jgi:hypothetical protein
MAKMFGVVILATILLATGRGIVPVLRSAGGIGSGWESTDERDADLGVVETDSVIRHTFRLTNSSVEPMEIVGVHTSCGCESADVRIGQTLGPGETLLIPYAMEARGAGLRQGTLTLETSSTDPSLRSVRFTVTARVPRTIWSEPETVEFRVAPGDSAPPSMTLVVLAADPARLSGDCRVSTSRELVSAERIERATFPVDRADRGAVDGLAFRVCLRDNPPPGMTMDYLAIEFDGFPGEVLHVPVIAAIDRAKSVLADSRDRAAGPAEDDGTEEGK